LSAGAARTEMLLGHQPFKTREEQYPGCAEKRKRKNTDTAIGRGGGGRLTERKLESRKKKGD